MFKYLNLLKSFTCLIFFLAPFYIYSQPRDTASAITNDSLNVFAIYESGFSTKNFEKNFFKVDTSLFGFQKNEIFYHKNPFYAKSANTGLAERSLIFQNDYDLSQISSHKYFSHYFTNNSNATYYNASSPYSNVFYMMGPKKEQAFDFLFTRNFGKLLNASVDYNLLFSPGKYKNQRSNDNFVSVTSNFHSENKKYIVLADYFYNRMRMQENGGIKYDSIFTQNLATGRDLIEVNLNNNVYSTVENTVKESGIYLRQYYFPGFFQNKKDTIKGNEKYISFGRISYSILFKNIEENYIDESPTSGFYQNIFIDTTLTHDSIQVNFIENKIEWSNIRYNINDSIEQHFLFSIGVKHRKQHIYNIDTVANINTLIPEAECNISFIPVYLNVNGFYIAGGYNKNDFSVNASADYKLSEKNNIERIITLGAASVSQTPCWYDQLYSSNHFQWDYDFVKINSQKLFFRYSGGEFSSEISFFNIDNPVFFDDYASPRQLNRSDRLIQLEMEKIFNWKNWSLDNIIIYQKIDGTDVIRLPEFISNHSLYFSKDFFKKALSAQFGAEVTFFSSYYPLAYMPATRQFYLQNDYKSSAYPYIDLFMNVKIKRIRIFLKLDHANSGLMGYDYLMIPHYPMADRSFKFGLSWNFYN